LANSGPLPGSTAPLSRVRLRALWSLVDRMLIDQNGSRSIARATCVAVHAPSPHAVGDAALGSSVPAYGAATPIVATASAAPSRRAGFGQTAIMPIRRMRHLAVTSSPALVVRPQDDARPPVCTEILNSGVVVMESAKDGARIDDTGPLNRARDRHILVQ
jgi:hypothetical protein